MGLKLITEPAEEPVTLAEARVHLRAPSGDTSQDSLIQALIAAAREYCEDYTHRRFITQTWDWVFDCFDAGIMDFPNAPLQSVTSIVYVDADGVTQTLAPSGYQVDAKSEPGRLMPAYGTIWPSVRSETLNAVTVRFVCGYGLASKVPKRIKAAMLLVLGHLYEHREDVSDFEVFQMPKGADKLLDAFRVERF